MLKGALALVIRYALYAVGGALVGVGAVTITGNDHMCMSISAVSDAIATGAALMLGGGATFAVSTVWSRIAKRLGGVT